MKSLLLLPFLFIASCATKPTPVIHTPPKAVVVSDVAVAAPSARTLRKESEAARDALNVANDRAKRAEDNAAQVAERAADIERRSEEVFMNGLVARSEEAKRFYEQMTALKKQAEKSEKSAAESSKSSDEARKRSAELEREVAVLEANNFTTVETLIATVKELKATREAVGKTQDNARVDVADAETKASAQLDLERAATTTAVKGEATQKARADFWFEWAMWASGGCALLVIILALLIKFKLL